MMVAQVLPFRRPATVDWRVQEALMELAARRSEELEQADAALPFLRRMELVAQECGPVAWQTYAALAMWHQRHARRWMDETPGTAA